MSHVPTAADAADRIATDLCARPPSRDPLTHAVRISRYANLREVIESDPAGFCTALCNIIDMLANDAGADARNDATANDLFRFALQAARQEKG